MDWEDVVMEVREFIREYLSKDEPVIHEEIEEITSKSQKNLHNQKLFSLNN